MAATARVAKHTAVVNELGFFYRVPWSCNNNVHDVHTNDMFTPRHVYNCMYMSVDVPCVADGWDALASAGLYLAGYDTQRRNAWGERVAALAAAEGFDSPENPDTACPICFEDFSSDLPTPDELSRSPPGRWACGNALNPRLRHAVCRGCDVVVQSNPRPTQRRCPICRSARVCFMHD